MGVKEYAESELLCHQLDYLGGMIKSMPMITAGLTRAEARQALLTPPDNQLLLQSTFNQ